MTFVTGISHSDRSRFSIDDPPKLQHIRCDIHPDLSTSPFKVDDIQLDRHRLHVGRRTRIAVGF